MIGARQQQGATLIELMVGVAIVGILAAIALPSYQNYRLKTTRPIGEECLVEAQRRVENAYAHTNSYPGTDLSSYGYSSSSATCGDENKYSISLSFPALANCPNTNAVCYVLTATANGSQAKDGNLLLTFDPTQTNPSKRLLRQHVPVPVATSAAVASWDFQPGQ